jgi:hypothetical protein
MPKANRAYRRSQDKLNPSRFRGTHPQARANRMHLLRTNLDNVKHSYLQSKDAVGDDCVVFCADASDRTMRAVAERMIGKDQVEQTILDHAKRKQTCTLHFALERNRAVDVLELMTPSGRRFVESDIPDGHFGIVVVQSGGNLYASLPKDGVPDHGMSSWLPLG